MSRSRGALSQGLVDRGWPHQVALPIDRCTGKNYEAPHAFCRGLDVYALHVEVSDGRERFLVFQFKEPDDASRFKNAFDGISFYPEDRKGRNWKRPPGDVRRPSKPCDPYDWR